MPIAIDQSVLMAVRKALLKHRESGHEPRWLILGDDERFRLEIELRERVTMPDGAIGEIKEIYGAKVAFHAVPSLLEVV